MIAPLNYFTGLFYFEKLLIQAHGVHYIEYYSLSTKHIFKINRVYSRNYFMISVNVKFTQS